MSASRMEHMARMVSTNNAPRRMHLSKQAPDRSKPEKSSPVKSRPTAIMGAPFFPSDSSHSLWPFTRSRISSTSGADDVPPPIEFDVLEWDKSTFVMSTLRRLAPLKSAPTRLHSASFAPLRFALRNFAPLRLQPVKSAPSRLTANMFASLRSVFERLAPDILALVRLAPHIIAPSRSVLVMSAALLTGRSFEPSTITIMPARRSMPLRLA